MSNTYKEKEREIPIIAHPDVLVVGGGPAGIGAAVGAAKAGAEVMIVESQGSFGGMWTNGLVITLGSFNCWLRPYRRCVDGVMGEWLRMAATMNGAEDNRSWVLNSDPEVMKLTADMLLLKYGIHCLLHTWMADVLVEDGKVKGVIVENVDGRGAITALCTVDCTGNGDVVARAGAEYDISDELQPMTLPFFLAGVKPTGGTSFEEELVIPFGPEPGYLGQDLLGEYTSRRRDIKVDIDLLNKAYSAGELPDFGGPWFGGLRENFPWVNTTRIYGSAVDALELTRCEMEGRRDARRIADFYKTNCKGFEDSWLMSSGSGIGIRESRRLRGVYSLTREDIVACTPFDDSIALGVWPIDVHPPKGQTGMHDMYVPLPYRIPYRCLLPIRLDGLLVGGRCISVGHEALGSVRVGAACGATGHGAGVAAALSVIYGFTPRELPYPALREELLKQNAIIE